MNSSAFKSLVISTIGHFRHLSSMGKRANELNREAAELSRVIHSIEKGLSIEAPRLGFGREKLYKIMNYVRRLETSESAYHREVCGVAIGALKGYLAFHADRGYSDEFFSEIEEFVSSREAALEEKPGGVFTVKKAELKVDGKAAEELFMTRHSVRDFSDEDVDDAVLLKALELAKRAPSACNRQGVRAYVLGKEKSEELAKKMSGVGGFADKAKRLIMITGKLSAYRAEETDQFIVSASFYAAYLTLALHAVGLGACVVQRPVVWSKGWEGDRRLYSIPDDEQLVIMLAVGNLKEEFRVPVSYRFQNEEMIRFL